MVSKRIVSGKHPLTVRIAEDDYQRMKIIAALDNMSVNEWIAEAALEKMGKSKVIMQSFVK